jgi:hypothetical protein
MSKRIRKHAFAELPQERCDYCLGLEYQLEKEKKILLWLNSLESPVLKGYIENTARIELDIENKLRDCKFPYCKGNCGGEKKNE